MFSPLKFIVLIAIIVAVWYGFKRFGQIGEERRRKVARDKRSSPAERRAEEIEDMVKCRYCDTYIPADHGGTCGRPECPGAGA